MGITLTSLFPDSVIFPFIGLDSVSQDRSALPRAELVYKGLADIITAGGVGDEQQLGITCAFPQNFSYALAEIHVGISTAAGTTNNWNNNGLASLVNADSPERSIILKMALTSHGIADTEAAPTRVYELDRATSTILVPPPNTTGAKLQLTFNNSTQADIAGTVNFYIRLYQFDVEQAHHYAVNTPVLTR